MHCLTWPTKRVHVASAHVGTNDRGKFDWALLLARPHFCLASVRLSGQSEREAQQLGHVDFSQSRLGRSGDCPSAARSVPLLGHVKRAFAW